MSEKRQCGVSFGQTWPKPPLYASGGVVLHLWLTHRFHHKQPTGTVRSEEINMINFNYLSLRDMEYVVAVADNGSFVRAAKQCRVAPPSLSAQIKKLELGLKIMIFERTTRKVLLTKEGFEFVSQARKVLDEARLLFSVAKRSHLPFGGRLRLAAISTLGPYLFPRVLSQLRQLYPGLSLSLEEGLTADLEAKLEAGTVDALLLSLPATQNHCLSAEIFDERFYLAVPRDRSPNDAITSHELMLLDDGHCLQQHALAACSNFRRSKRHTTSLETLKYMVALGEGCTIVPALAMSPADAVDYLPLSSQADKRTVGLCWRGSDPHSSDFEDLAEAFRRILSSCKSVTVNQVFPAYDLAGAA